MKNKKLLVISSLLLILFIAVFFRFWRLDSTPPGLYPDVAINGNNALDSLESNDFKLFYPDNNGREGIFMWLISLSFWLFSPSVLTIKVVSDFFGTLTVLGLFLLAREIFSDSKERNVIALLSSFFLAV